MLDEVRALGFIRQLDISVGACAPVILQIKTSNGELCEAYVKLADNKPLTIQALITESICSMLAVDLGLATPEPYLVKLEKAFIESVHSPQIASRLANSCSMAFGTKAIPSGFTEVPKDTVLQPNDLQTAAAIYVFDALIDNYDRSYNVACKVNCLLYNGKFYIIDHEKAFKMIVGAKSPWLIGSLDHLRQPGMHLFTNQLRNAISKLDFAPIAASWKTITDERLDGYLKALPQEWSQEAEFAQKIKKIITNLRDNIEGCLVEIKRVLGSDYA